MHMKLRLDTNKDKYYSKQNFILLCRQTNDCTPTQGMQIMDMDLPGNNSTSGISTLGLARGGTIGILIYQSMSALLNLGQSATSGIIGDECFQPPLDISSEFIYFLYLL